MHLFVFLSFTHKMLKLCVNNKMADISHMVFKGIFLNEDFQILDNPWET